VVRFGMFQVPLPSAERALVSVMVVVSVATAQDTGGSLREGAKDHGSQVPLCLAASDSTLFRQNLEGLPTRSLF
jgi:hypothetical protein